MATLYPSTDSFVRGEISPRLHARASLELYRAGLARCLNFLTLPHGGIRKRGGSYFVAETKNSGKARLIPFVFSSEQAYVLELGELYLRVYAYGARVGTVEVATPWSAAQLGDLQFYQSADQMWIAHPAHALRVLTRTAHTTWTLAVYELGDGPYDEMDTQGTLLTPADYGALTPVMTSNSTPSGAVSSSPAAADAWEAFDKNKATWADFQGGATGWIVYQGTSAAVVDHYYFTAMKDAGEVNRTPISWVLEGSNDGATWVTLDTRSAETIWTAGETRFYEFTNQAAFLFHRFRWNGTDGDIWTDAGFAELGVNRTAASQTAFALTASSVAGINGGAGFQAGDVGRPVRLQGSDGVWRWAEIVSRVSATVVTVKLHGHALPDLSPISRWQLGAFKAGNQASAVTIYEERLALARRFSVFMSKTGDLDDFGIGEADDDEKRRQRHGPCSGHRAPEIPQDEHEAGNEQYRGDREERDVRIDASVELQEAQDQ